ncbi:MAG: hypothetical protein K9K75_04185 [Deltaproteobacteria bacterium]|nr:hypothetical protein [Deltaproteobacteria bacterium]
MEAGSGPQLWIFAGPNGSGKSTVVKHLNHLKDFPKIYINADDIGKAKEISTL